MCPRCQAEVPWAGRPLQEQQSPWSCWLWPTSSPGMLISSFCHLRLFIAYFTRITLYLCLEVRKGEDSWSVTTTCSTSINLFLFIKSWGSFTSVMSFYFITQPAVHETVFPHCVNVGREREETRSSLSLCHQLPVWDQEARGNVNCLNSEWRGNRLKVLLCTVTLYSRVFCLTGLNKKNLLISVVVGRWEGQKV